MTDVQAIVAADVAAWHEQSAEGYANLNEEHKERWPDEGDVPRYVSARKFHLAAALAVRAALIEEKQP